MLKFKLGCYKTSAPATDSPRNHSQWITGATGMLQSQTAAQISHGNAEMASSGELAALEQRSSEQRRRPACLFPRGRPISDQRSRLY